MLRKIYTTAPEKYPVCLLDDCPMAHNCLHWLAYAQLAETADELRLVNPRRCSRDADCRFYRDAKPVRYARGFINIQKRMYPAQYEHFMYAVMNHFGRSSYFERRRGRIPLPPREQQIVLDALREVGVTGEVKFDAYEECPNWYD